MTTFACYAFLYMHMCSVDMRLHHSNFRSRNASNFFFFDFTFIKARKHSHIRTQACWNRLLIACISCKQFQLIGVLKWHQRVFARMYNRSAAFWKHWFLMVTRIEEAIYFICNQFIAESIKLDWNMFMLFLERIWFEWIWLISNEFTCVRIIFLIIVAFSFQLSRQSSI